MKVVLYWLFYRWNGMSMISNVTNSRGRIIPQTNLMLNFRFLILHPVWKILLPVQKILMTSGFEDQILLWSWRQKHKIWDKFTKEIKLDYILQHILNFLFLLPLLVQKILLPVQKILMTSGFEDQILLWSWQQKHKILDTFTKEICRSEIKLAVFSEFSIFTSTYFRCRKFYFQCRKF